MRLKRINLHGYKTFANQTEFVFDKGITAIVGPNGSGKSNVADAVRWVLGEQAYSVMRGKKTEDMIFSGSNERSRMGMAEVVITLDNVDNFLPIDFDEVVIGRRAYRSGDNEYYINGSRVRLRDVHELLDRSGLGRRTHTVIGQGMIDQALALKPEDRRALFEEAAGITIYRTKRRQTLDRLGKTEDNLTRVQDIISEIAPRMRQLERQANRVRQHEEISDQLRDLLRTWYGYNWHMSLSKLVDARSALNHWQQVIERTNAGITTFNADTASLRQHQLSLRNKLTEWRQQLAEHEDRRSSLEREQAVSQERQRSVRSGIERLQHEIVLLTERLEGEMGRLEEADAALMAIEASKETHQLQFSQVQAQLNAQETARRETEEELAASQKKHLDFVSRVADRSYRIDQAKERLIAIEEERDLENVSADSAGQEALQLQTQHDQLGQKLSELGEQISTLKQRHRNAQARQQSLLSQKNQLEQQRSELDAQLRALQARYDLLDRLRLEGEGLYAGVRHVLRASQKGSLRGILGPIATLLNVPGNYEQAVEIALGARIQDVVVGSWSDADQAIEYLKSTRGGRATFLPLDNLRPQRRRQMPNESGVIGWAADLVEHSPEVAPAVELLLGQILVVEDLGVASRVSRQAERPRIVTLDGDFVHPGGSVSGGSRAKRQQGGMLAREREWRTLPDDISRTATHIKELLREIESLNQAIIVLDEELTDSDRHSTELADVEKEQTAILARLQNGVDRARQTEAWHRERSNKLALDTENVGRQLVGLRQEVDEFSEQLNRHANRIAVLEEKLGTLGTTGLLQAVAHSQARLDVIEDNYKSQYALVENQRHALAQMDAELSDRRRRLETLEQDNITLDTRIVEFHSTLETTLTTYESVIAIIQPAQAEMDTLEEGWINHDRKGEMMRERLHNEELQLNQAQLNLQRAEDHLTYLRSQIEHDFGLVSLETTEGYSAQDPLPFDQIVTTLPRVQVIPPDTNAEIRRLKSILNRLGPINPDAKEDYDTTKERFDFLTQQSDDLQEAAQQMRKVIGELDQLMDQEFRRTFKLVSKAFTGFFTRLFAGGTAKLVLTDAEDITATGVEIIARPPGKRPANLSILSGGERALTAAALIFSILSVSPTPFCVLDEIDAALDEANISRVSDVLVELTSNAQLILITHNRGTLEVANTIYGVSMGGDSVSQSLSLKLEEGKLQATA